MWRAEREDKGVGEGRGMEEEVVRRRGRRESIVEGGGRGGERGEESVG